MRLGLCFFFIAFLGVVFGNGIFSSAAASQCNVSIAHCSNQEDFLMESEISRRFLAQTNYPTSIANIATKADVQRGGSTISKAVRPYNPECKNTYCTVRENMPR
ncbi:hypothetical protein AAC387_Pa02g1374 [Persea americana]